MKMSKRDLPQGLEQDLSQEGEFQRVYIIYLLFREKGVRPSARKVQKKLSAAFGKVDVVAETDGTLTTFALLEHLVSYSDGKLPAELLLGDFAPFDQNRVDDVARTQLWDCAEGEDLLSECRWQLPIMDFMASGLPYKERCAILARWAEIAAGLFPGCTAVWFQPSGKLLTPRQLAENPLPDANRFLYGGVNIRFFNIEGTEDKLVDTLGLYAIGLPDLQYHFHGLDPNQVVRHASSVAAYIYDEDAPIKAGDTIDGFTEEGITPELQWPCQYEMSLIQPSREVMDIEMMEFASGDRE